VAALVACAAGFGGAWWLQGVRWDAADGRRAAAEAQARTDAEAEFMRRLQEQQNAATEAAQTLRRARLDAAAAGRAADSLRSHVATLAQQFAATAPGSAPGSGPGDMLADMLRRVEEAGRELAAEADRARAAGKACERAYDALTTTR
jgi:uncharacterized protein HemX